MQTTGAQAARVLVRLSIALLAWMVLTSLVLWSHAFELSTVRVNLAVLSNVFEIVLAATFAQQEAHVCGCAFFFVLVVLVKFIFVLSFTKGLELSTKLNC